MKKSFFFWIPTAAMLLVSGCATVGNGVAMEKSFDDIQVTGLQISGPWQVNVVCNAAENSCTVRAEENFWNMMTLRRRSDFRAEISSSIKPTQPLSITVRTTGNIGSISAAEGAVVNVSDNRISRLDAEVRDSSRAVVGGVSIDVVNAELDDNAELDVNARIGTLNLESCDVTVFKADKVVVGNIKMEDNASVILAGAEDLNVKMYDNSRLSVGVLAGVIRGIAKDRAVINYGGTGHTMLKSAGTVVVEKK